MGEILGRKALSHTCFDELQNSNGSSFWYRQWLLVLQAIKGGVMHVLMSFKIQLGLLLSTDNGSLCYKQSKEESYMFLMSFKIQMGLLLGTDNGSLCYKQLKEAMHTK
jgi:hypothetical protein